MQAGQNEVLVKGGSAESSTLSPQTGQIGGQSKSSKPVSGRKRLKEVIVGINPV
jgi:hypothetical protein